MTYSAIRSYKDLTTWQIAQDLCLLAYNCTNHFPKHELFSLTSQIRRSAISIPSNIAEGFGRQTAKEKQQFYHHSLGSLFELDTQIDISSRLGYLEQSEIKVMDDIIEHCRRLLLALLNANRAKITNPKSQILRSQHDSLNY